MKKQKNIIRLSVLRMAVCIAVLFLYPTVALSQETYKFERMFPVLPQPWYFAFPTGVAVDNDGYVYIVDMYAHNIQKFTGDGHFVTKWGGKGEGDGVFKSPTRAAIDNKNGFIYVTDSVNNRVQKFTLNGAYVTQWTTYEIEGIYSKRPRGIAVSNAADGTVYVYVTDTHLHSVEKFKDNGEPIDIWGKKDGSIGTGDMEFNQPSDIAADNEGNLYVADSGNFRIQKFTSDGQFVTKWGIEGEGDGQFKNPQGITVKNSFVYVTDPDKQCIQQFTTEGVFKAKWQISVGSPISDGIYKFPDENIDTVEQESKNFSCGIAINENGYNLYLANTFNHAIQKFDLIQNENAAPVNLELANTWSATGIKDGMFERPIGMAMDSDNGVIYVADSGNHRIQKFDLQGNFKGKWGSKGDKDKEFNGPAGIAVDKERGFIYVADSGNNRIQKFDLQETFIEEWRKWKDGTKEKELKIPTAVAVDSNGDVYVSDTGNCRIQKFTSKGVFITGWQTSIVLPPLGVFPSVTVPALPTGIAISRENNEDYLYVIAVFAKDLIKGEIPDIINYYIQFYFYIYGNKKEIQKYKTSDPNSVNTFKNCEITDPTIGNLFADNTYLYYADFSDDSFVHKFNLSDGSEVAKIVNFGSYPGQLRYPLGLCAKDEKLYIADTVNHRIQVFRKGAENDKRSKAILVAGASKEETSYSEFQMNVNFAYRVLLSQGFTKETIYYLSHNKNVDLDDNGYADDVDGDPTKENLKKAITEWAVKNSDDVVLYLIAHGLDNNFKMTPECLTACELSSYLNTLQNNSSVRVIVINDSCHSGTFLSELSEKDMESCPDAEKQTQERERIVITTTSPESPDGNANFEGQGFVSFSNFFWTRIFYGKKVKDTFVSASEAIGSLNQDPQLNGNYNKIYNENYDDNNYDDYDAADFYIGNGTIFSKGPDITNISDITYDDSSLPLTVKLLPKVTDDDGITRVWAYIRHPDYIYDLDKPIPSIDLQRVNIYDYEGIYEIDKPGLYQVMIYAIDTKLNPSAKTIKLRVGNPTCKAILAAGWSPKESDLRAATKNNIRLAYNTLNFCQYQSDDIYLISQEPIEGMSALPVKPSIEDLKHAIESWAANNAQDVVIYLKGKGKAGEFQISETEWLKAEDLDKWLDNLQKNITGIVTVIYDADYSGSFLPLLIPPDGKKRIVISSTAEDKEAHFLLQGDTSFSNFFWREIGNDMTIGDSFSKARTAVENKIGDKCLLDSSGNGIGNEKDIDIKSANDYKICKGIIKPPGCIPDKYEDDDDYLSPGDIVINDSTAQKHNFDIPGDEDWIKFYALAEKTYKIEATNLGINCDVVIELYDESLKYVDSRDNPDSSQSEEVLEWKCEREGFYYVRIRHAKTYMFCDGTEYELKIYYPIAGDWRYVKGFIRDACTEEPIIGAIIKSKNDNGAVIGGCISLPPDNPSDEYYGGAYTIAQEVGTGTITVDAEGYCSATQNTVINTHHEEITLDFKLLPLGMGKLSGVIKDTDNNPVANAQIKADGGSSAVSNADGKYSMALNTSVYSLTVDATGYCPAIQPVQVSECSETKLEDIKLVSTDGKGELSGIITDSTNKLIANAKITSDNCNGSVVSQSDGKYTISLDTGKECNIKVEAECYKSFEIKKTVNDCQITTLDIPLNPLVKGDINGDGSVTLDDALIALQIIAGLRTDNICQSSDVNGDKKIGLAEVVYVIQKVAGLIPSRL